MANVSLPTPVFLAGGALCLVAGYLIGTVTGPDTPHRTTAAVVSFDGRDSKLCLSGESVKDEKAVVNGILCGTWSHPAGVTIPKKGDNFRFVSLDTAHPGGQQPQFTTVLYGTVVE